jgi:hypothetical protein
MNERWTKILLVCAVAIATQHGLRAQGPDQRVQNLVVMIDGKLGDSPTLGGGVIFGSGQDRLYIVTANHVVRRGADQAKELKVQFKWLPGEPQQATLLTTSDVNLDLAVLAVTGLNRIGISNGAVPFDLLGDASSLKRGDAAHTLGYPNGRTWDMPVTADVIATAAGGSIQFESAFLYPGNSGGALLNGKYELIGLVRKDEPPNGEAASIDTIMDKLKSWGYPVSLRRDAGARPSGAGVAVMGNAAGGSKGLPNFAGTWELFEATMNGAAQQIRPGSRMMISQSGTTVHIGNQDLAITAAGTVVYHNYSMQDGTTRRMVSTEDQADVVETLTRRVEGDVLVSELTLYFKKQVLTHPPGTELRITKYRRVSADTGNAPVGASALPPSPCHIQDVVFLGRSGAIRDALARVTIDSFGPALAGQAIRVVVSLSAGDPMHMLLERRLDTMARPGAIDIPATLNIGVRTPTGVIPPEQVNREATTATIYVFPGPNSREIRCTANFPIRFQ